MPTRPCWVEIDTAALEKNFRFLASLAGADADCLAIVKADAYGHSLALCAPAAVRAGTQWLGVTSVEEGVAARSLCPATRILVIGGVFPGQGRAVIASKLTPAVWTLQQMDELEHAARSAGAAPGSFPVHLEIDTGMSRQGVGLDELDVMLARFTADSRLRIEAAMTHLYASDEGGGTESAIQLARLEGAIRSIQTTVPESGLRWVSVGASAALLGADAAAIRALAERVQLGPLLRLGLALYGIGPRFTPSFPVEGEPLNLAAAKSQLKPVLAWKTRIASIRHVDAGAEVGYNGTFVATEPMRLALLPVGYADGLDRRLGNRFSLLVQGQRAPVAGRISMDQTVVDVTEISGAQVGDEVVILGSQGGEEVSVFDHAEAAETIPWEVFTRIAARVPRLAV